MIVVVVVVVVYGVMRVGTSIFRAGFWQAKSITKGPLLCLSSPFEKNGSAH